MEGVLGFFYVFFFFREGLFLGGVFLLGWVFFIGCFFFEGEYMKSVLKHLLAMTVYLWYTLYEVMYLILCFTFA